MTTAFFAGAVLSVVFTLVSFRLARRWAVFDQPGDLKVHVEPISRFGGLGFAVSTLLTYSAISLRGHASVTAVELAAVVLGAGLAALTGALDDIYQLRPMQKLCGQLMAGALFGALSWVGYEHQIMQVVGSLLPVTLAHGAFVLVSACWLALVSNSINLLDGLDGLAGGISLVLSVTLSLMGALATRVGFPILLWGLAGALIAFLFYNLPKAKTFMGDIGSLFLGAVLAMASLDLAVAATGNVSHLAAALLVLLLPLLDTALAIFRRFRRKQDIMQGDRLHIYDGLHRATKQRIWLTLCTMWGLAAICGYLGLIAFRLSIPSALMLLIGTLGSLIALAVSFGAAGSQHE